MLPPQWGGREHLIISEGKQLVISGFTPQWGGAFGLRGGVGGSISQIFGISFSEKFTPQWGGVWGGVFWAEGGGWGAVHPMGNRASYTLTLGSVVTCS